ncbi:MAG: GNAT family N-acetyltransferase [Microcoleaceae cyanobacterium]
MIRAVEIQDIPAICQIYNHYIRNTVVTFEEVEVSVADIQGRIQAVIQSHCWLVYVQQEQVLGYAYAKPWHSRSAYRFSVESSVYVDPEFVGRGIGRQLYQVLLGQLRQFQVRTVIGIIALPNPASIGLHEKFGFEQAAHFKSVGYKFNQWIDVGYWQLLFG